jgi:hypothetical protein
MTLSPVGGASGSAASSASKAKGRLTLEPPKPVVVQSTTLGIPTLGISILETSLKLSVHAVNGSIDMNLFVLKLSCLVALPVALNCNTYRTRK